MAATELSTRQLRAFVALVDLPNFTRAAQACHLSQPAFSTLIRALELAFEVGQSVGDWAVAYELYLAALRATEETPS